MSKPFVDPQNKPDLLRQINDIAAKYAIRAATVGGMILVLLDFFGGPQPGAFLLSGCTLLGSAVIATAIKGRPA
jgi:hypothetical protein